MSRELIVHLTSVHTPFDIRIFQKECSSLIRAGYDVALIAPYHKNDVVEGVQIVAIPKTQNRCLRMTKTSLQVFHKALRLNAHLYHFHDPELIPIGLMLRALGKQVVYDIHENVPRSLFATSRDYMPHFLKRYISFVIEHFENISAHMFSGLISATPAIGNRFKHLRPYTEVINNYPIADDLISVNKVSWDERSLSVAYVGGIVSERGIKQMVEAMSCIPDYFNAQLKLAGSFYPPQIRNDVARLSGWKHVDELGFIDRKKMARLLSQVRAGLVLFHPEPNHIQSQPNKIYEYMSASIPIIASNFPLWKKIVEENGCGIVVNPLEPKEISKAITYIFEHPEEAEAMGSRGRKLVEKQFNWSNEEKKLLRLYEKLLST